jgi:mRNA-degrading endonuclease YafQ of YafQ-DinJ toxin-antitoxin module
MELNKDTRENIINYIKELNDDINQLNKDIKNLQAKRDTRKEKIKGLINVLSNQLELEIE